MSECRFRRVGTFVIDADHQRRASFYTEREAQESAEFLNDSPTWQQIEAYVWEQTREEA